MVRDVYPLVVLLLTTSFTFTEVSKDTCDVHALVGHSLTLALDHKTLSDRDTLRWTHNSSVLVNRPPGARDRKLTIIDPAGSLQLRNLNFSSAGVYKADVINATGARVNGRNARVCVMEKVSKPAVTFVCEPGGAAATLSCNALNPRDLVFAWTHEGRLLIGETKPTLRVLLAKSKADKDFSCSVRNAASQDQSNAVRFKCEPPPPVVYCFKAGTVMAAVAGGSGLVLLLFIILLVSCYRQKKERQHQGDLSMAPITELLKTEDYEIMNPSEVSPGPSPKPSPRPSPTVYGQDVFLSVPKAQVEHRTTPPEGKREPSPVPKPRTKVPQAAEK